ncbi:hypothetical protein [Streptococcus chenjunshii]|nr:hypothetical protein [Streptococcus chenjunshii]
MKKVGKGCFGCFGIIGIIVVAGVCGLLFFFGESDNSNDSASSASSAVSNNAISSSKSTDASTETVNSGFAPTDTADTTIESIVTYNDYLKMYETIVNEYITNYETVVSQYGLGDAASYQSMRDSVTSSIEQQKAEYGPMGNAKIIGKADLVEFLKEYRDELKSYTDQMAIALQ